MKSEPGWSSTSPCTSTETGWVSAASAWAEGTRRGRLRLFRDGELRLCSQGHCANGCTFEKPAAITVVRFRVRHHKTPSDPNVPHAHTG